jgi:hypothetical protein
MLINIPLFPDANPPDVSEPQRVVNRRKRKEGKLRLGKEGEGGEEERHH